jgi:hypothetical protein
MNVRGPVSDRAQKSAILTAFEDQSLAGAGGGFQNFSDKDRVVSAFVAGEFAAIEPRKRSGQGRLTLIVWRPIGLTEIMATARKVDGHCLLVFGHDMDCEVRGVDEGIMAQ